MKLERLMELLLTFEMNLEEDKGDKKVKWIAFQSSIISLRLAQLICEDDDPFESIIKLSKNFNEIMKRMNRGNKTGPISKNYVGVPTGFPIARRKNTSNNGNFNAGFHNKNSAGNMPELMQRIKKSNA